MPELPEVEVTCQALRHLILHEPIIGVAIRNPRLRTPIPPSFATEIIGRSITEIKRIGKYFIFILDNQKNIMGHLGMSGSFRFEKHTENQTFLPQKHDHVILHYAKGTLAYHDPRRFGFLSITPDATSYLYHKLGYDPFTISAQQFEDLFKQKHTTIKSALFNQKYVVGLGNIYICEMLFECGISPFRLCCHITSQEYQKLHQSMQRILTEAIKQGGSTLKDFHNPDQKTGYFQRDHKVYQRTNTPCSYVSDNGLTCNGRIIRVAQNNRSTFYCPAHQK